MGLANALAAVEAGVDRFDASLSGLGGCSYLPGHDVPGQVMHAGPCWELHPRPIG
jgi:hypothetical protein